MAIYMQIEGIEGTVTEDKHKKWIEVDRLGFSVSREVAMVSGKVADRANAKPQFAEISTGKSYDDASPKLFTWGTVGTAKKVVIHFTKDDNNTFIEITLTDTLLSRYSLDGAGASDPSESFSLNYTKIEIKRIPYDAQNKAGTPIPVGYDLAAMKAC